jgi:UDP:flavonoid glycosyltransferase YjiC (YdhE family)
VDTPFQHENITVAHEPGLTRALRDSDIVVARGSQNAVAACLLAGVPVIGTPGTRDSEPLFNMGVLEGHGAGRTILGTPTAADLADAAQELSTGGAAHRAARLGDALRRHGGAVEAVRAIEESPSRRR